jgi:hypothetical protein
VVVQLLFAFRVLANLPGGFWAFLALLYSCVFALRDDDDDDDDDDGD